MRTRSRAGAPVSERARPLTTCALDVALYGTVASRATRSGAPTDRQDHVSIERRAIPAGIEPREGDIARQLAMQGRHLLRLDGARGVGGPVVVNHRAGNCHKAIPRVEKLEQARLAWPVD